MNVRALTSTLAVAICATGLSVGVGVIPAVAAHPRCASKADYRKIKHGQTVARVQHELHSKGHVNAHSSSGGYREVDRSFKTCDKYGAIDVAFSADPHKPLRESAKDGVFE